MKIYVGNLPFSTHDADLAALFGPYGAVASTQVILDRDTGRSRGFGFVEMADAEEGARAIAALHNASVEGRALVVNEARPLEERPPRREGGRGRGRGRGFGRPARG